MITLRSLQVILIAHLLFYCLLNAYSHRPLFNSHFSIISTSLNYKLLWSLFGSLKIRSVAVVPWPIRLLRPNCRGNGSRFSHVRLSLYTQNSPKFSRYRFEMFHTSLSPKEAVYLSICQYWTTIAYSCHTNWPIKIMFFMENFFIWHDVFTKKG